MAAIIIITFPLLPFPEYGTISHIWFMVAIVLTKEDTHNVVPAHTLKKIAATKYEIRETSCSCDTHVTTTLLVTKGFTITGSLSAFDRW